MNNSRQVSVIVPVYDVGPYLRRCLDSLVGQTLRDIEIICVDDGSTDESGAILGEYAARDARVRVIRQENAGAGVARNAGLDAATGEYLFFCDPDDWCDCRMLEKMYAKARRTEADVVVASVYEVDAEGGHLVGARRIGKCPRGVFDGPRAGSGLFRISRHTVWDKLFRRAFIAANDIRFQEIRRFNDMLFCDLALACAERIATLRYPGYRHRIARAGGLQSGRGEDLDLLLVVYDTFRGELNRRNLFAKYEAAFAEAFLVQSLNVMFTAVDFDAFSRFYDGVRARTRQLPAVRAAVVRDPFVRRLMLLFDVDLTPGEFAFTVVKNEKAANRAPGNLMGKIGIRRALAGLLPPWLKARI